jgi:hypothetical protein
MNETLPQPWSDFLHELDGDLTAPTEFHCLGGFAVEVVYGLPRLTATADVDVLVISPSDQRDDVLQRAGKGSPLFRKYGLYIDFIPSIPATVYEYESRLKEAFPCLFKNLSFKVLDPYDLALSKLGNRNSEKDREDVLRLALAMPLDLGILRERYKGEVRPYVANQEREDLTFQLWIEMIEEERSR